MPKVLSRMMSFRRRAVVPEGSVKPAAVPAKAGGHPRIGLWVLAAFATVSALVTMSALVIGPQSADAMVVIPLVLFWCVTVSVGFAIRSALLNVVRSMAPRKQDKADATLDRLARMARIERNRAELHPHLARGLVHAA